MVSKKPVDKQKREEQARRYQKMGLSTPEIARLLGCSSRAILNYLKKPNTTEADAARPFAGGDFDEATATQSVTPKPVVRLSQSSQESIRIAKRLISIGRSNSEIRKQVNLSEHTLDQLRSNLE